MKNNTRTPILSVIVPLYNCAPVIIRCLDCIDSKDCEIIVVNDGSTDRGAEEVREYMFTHPNVRLIDKSNGGVSSARNCGIREAKGKYISFIDADDYISRGGLDRIVLIAEEKEADVVKFANNNVKDGVICEIPSVRDFPIEMFESTGKGVLERFDISDYVVWDGIYRRDMIVDNEIFFKEDLSLHEDDVFMGMLYCHAKKVVSTDLPLYNYVVASDWSSTHRQSVEKQRKLIRSGINAMRYRSRYVREIYPSVMDREKLKYMRWVCSVRRAVDAGMSYRSYRELLNAFGIEGVWPLKYAWIKAAGWDFSYKIYLKRVLQTFMVNNPILSWPLMKIYCKIREK